MVAELGDENMSLHSQHVNRPKNWQDFEHWCLKLFRKALACPALSKFGREGQKQGGIDLIGNDGNGRCVAVQCKARELALKSRQVDADIDRAATEHPEISRLVIATTARRSAALQKHVLARDRSNHEKGLARIEIWFWNDIEEYLSQDLDLLGELEGAPVTVGIQTLLREAIQKIEPTEANGSPEVMADRIDRAFSYINQGNPERTISLLREMWEHEWEVLSEALKYRVLGNLANGYYAKGDFKEAGRLYLEARKHWDTPHARMLEARGHFLLGEHDVALELARALVSEHPDQTSASAIVVQASTEPYEHLRQSLTPSQRSDGEVALALSYRALDEERIDEAITHARDALVAHDGWNVASINLAGMLLGKARRNAFVSPEGNLRVTDQELVEEAEALLSSVLAGREQLSAYSIGIAAYNRSSARKLLGRLPEALKDLDEAVRLLPDDAAIVATYAATLESQGNVTEARRQWERAASLDPRNCAYATMLAATILEEGAPGADKDAHAILTKATEPAGHASRDIVFELAQLWCETRPEGDSSTTAIEPVLPAGSIAVLRAAAALNGGDSEGADAELAEWTTASMDDAGIAERLFAARLLRRLQRFADGLKVIRPVADAKQLSQPTIALLRLAAEGGEDQVVLDVCSTLRESGNSDPSTLELEARVRLRYEDRGTAIDIIKSWAEIRSDDPDPWLYLGNAALDVGDTASASAALAQLPDPTDLPADRLQQWYRVVLLASGCTVSERRDLAYRAWRAHRDSSEA